MDKQITKIDLIHVTKCPLCEGAHTHKVNIIPSNICYLSTTAEKLDFNLIDVVLTCPKQNKNFGATIKLLGDGTYQINY